MSIATILASGCTDLDIDHHVRLLPFTRLAGQPGVVEAQCLTHAAVVLSVSFQYKQYWKHT